MLFKLELNCSGCLNHRKSIDLSLFLVNLLYNSEIWVRNQLVVVLDLIRSNFIKGFLAITALSSRNFALILLFFGFVPFFLMFFKEKFSVLNYNLMLLTGIHLRLCFLLYKQIVKV